MIISTDKVLSLIGDKRLVPVGFVTILIYATVWIVHMDDKVTAQASTVSEIKKAQMQYNKTLNRLDKRVALVQQKLDIKVDEKDMDLIDDDSQ